MTMAESEAKFTELVNTKEKRARRFQQGLKQWIQNRVTVFKLTDYATLVQKESIVKVGSEQARRKERVRKGRPKAREEAL